MTTPAEDVTTPGDSATDAQATDAPATDDPATSVPVTGETATGVAATVASTGRRVLADGEALGPPLC